jgi:hypothetical protein
MRLKKKALGTGRRSMGLCYQGQLHDPAPRGEGKEEIRLIDLPGNPTFYMTITIIREKSRA